MMIMISNANYYIMYYNYYAAPKIGEVSVSVSVMIVLNFDNKLTLLKDVC